MITLYLWDEQGIYFGSVEVLETDPMPPRSTPTAPPDCHGEQVACWQGGWIVLDSAPVVPEPQIDWPEQIAERRWQHETGGIVLGGIPVATDDRSKTLINGAALRASREPDYTLRWKTAEGFIDLPADQVLSMADAVADHVQACFDREAELLAAVTDGSITAEMLEHGWP